MLGIGKEKLQDLSVRIIQLREKSVPYSYQEYFSYALELAVQSLEEGNFGVGTVIVCRSQGREYVIGGRNQVFSKKDSSLHGDKDALQKLELLEKSEFTPGKKTQQICPDDIILQREAPDMKTNLLLITTLESCAGCYQQILTHNTFGTKITQICSGNEFPDSGSEHPFRSRNLPPTWKRMIDSQNVMIFTLWDSEVQHLCQDVFNFQELEVQQKEYNETNPQTLYDFITNVEELIT